MSEVQGGATVQYNFDRNLAVWLQFRPNCYEWNTNYQQELSTRPTFEFPCKPLLGPSPELMQPQFSLRVVQGSSSVAPARKRSMLEVKMGCVGVKRPFWGHFCSGSASLALYCAESRLITMLQIRNYGVIYKTTLCTVQSVPYRTVHRPAHIPLTLTTYYFYDTHFLLDSYFFSLCPPYLSISSINTETHCRLSLQQNSTPDSHQMCEFQTLAITLLHLHRSPGMPASHSPALSSLSIQVRQDPLPQQIAQASAAALQGMLFATWKQVQSLGNAWTWLVKGLSGAKASTCSCGTCNQSANRWQWIGSFFEVERVCMRVRVWTSVYVCVFAHVWVCVQVMCIDVCVYACVLNRMC